MYFVSYFLSFVSLFGVKDSLQWQPSLSIHTLVMSYQQGDSWAVWPLPQLDFRHNVASFLLFHSPGSFCILGNSLPCQVVPREDLRPNESHVRGPHGSHPSSSELALRCLQLSRRVCVEYLWTKLSLVSDLWKLWENSCLLFYTASFLYKLLSSSSSLMWEL